ncbi:hypothetical protein ABTC28_19845, partial [Acinetobacter baumannii]
SCIDSGGRSHNRIVAMCSVRRLDLGAEMVGSGLARDCPAFSGGIYGPIEMIAPRRVAYDLPGYCDRQ